MKKIKFIATPPGFAPEHIREQWLGVELPILGTEDPVEGLKQIRTGIENLGGYEVATKDALQALKDAGKEEAVEFWTPLLKHAPKLVFKKEVCELIE